MTEHPGPDEATAQRAARPRCGSALTGLFDRRFMCDGEVGHKGAHHDGLTYWDRSDVDAYSDMLRRMARKVTELRRDAHVAAMDADIKALRAERDDARKLRDVSLRQFEKTVDMLEEVRADRDRLSGVLAEARAFHQETWTRSRERGFELDRLKRENGRLIRELSTLRAGRPQVGDCGNASPGNRLAMAHSVGTVSHCTLPSGHDGWHRDARTEARWGKEWAEQGREEGPSLFEVDSALLELLREAMGMWGPRVVAQTAAKLAAPGPRPGPSPTTHPPSEACTHCATPARLASSDPVIDCERGECPNVDVLTSPKPGENFGIADDCPTDVRTEAAKRLHAASEACKGKHPSVDLSAVADWLDRGPSDRRDAVARALLGGEG